MLKNIFFPTLWLLLPGLSAFTQNQPPLVTIQSVEVDQAAQSVTVTYDLEDPEETELEVFLRAAPTGSPNFNISAENVSGAIGFPVSPGTGLQITWNYAGEIGSDDSYDFKVIADDRYAIPIEELVAQVDSQMLRARMEHITGVRHYIANSGNLNRCRDTLEQAFLEYGLEAYRQNFPNIGTTAHNIIGDHWGKTNSNNVIIIDGHYDTVSDSPGADDNASAIVGVLEAARILSAYHFRKSLRFIGFDFEETGLDGSIYYVDHLSNTETIEGVLNLEMIGYYSDAPNSQTFPQGFELLFPEANAELEAEDGRGNFLINVGAGFGADLYQAFNEAAATYVPELRVIGLEIANPLLAPVLLRSDHAPFWNAEIPALMLTDGAEFRNPNYHEPSDTIGTLNFTFIANNVKAAIATAATMAQPMHSGEAVASNLVITDASHHHELPCSYFLSPNPAQEVFTIRFGDCQPMQLQIRLFDVKGQQIWQGQHDSTAGSLQVPVAHCVPGVYWLQLSDGHAFSSQRVLIH
ncbi:MAG: M28 family peptidase [Phaeodactylibacter sp.]|uniref:M28 family peptidase n=1 Tax=Phaeodactylibacter sp. TaxID=1940289 RepID=UPI0032ED1DF9